MSQHLFAVVTTVKNEEDLIGDTLRYYQALGASHIWCFLDDSTDNTKEIASRFESVEVCENIKPDDLIDPPPWLCAILPRWSENMDVRKRVNTYFAAGMAAAQGITWLAAIDADELIIVNDHSKTDKDSFYTMLASVPEAVDQILLPNMDVVPEVEGIQKPFHDCTLFLKRFPITEAASRLTKGALRYLGCKPMSIAWFDYYFQKIRFHDLLPRLYYNPVNRSPIPAGYFLGYANCKPMVRSKRVMDMNFNIHRWQATGRRRLFNVEKGNVLHYDLYGASAVRKKFAQRNHVTRFNAHFARNEIARLALDLSDEAFTGFFGKNLVLTDETRRQLLLNRGVVERITCVRDWMRASEGLS